MSALTLHLPAARAKSKVIVVVTGTVSAAEVAAEIGAEEVEIAVSAAVPRGIVARASGLRRCWMVVLFAQSTRRAIAPRPRKTVARGASVLW